MVDKNRELGGFCANLQAAVFKMGPQAYKNRDLYPAGPGLTEEAENLYNRANESGALQCRRERTQGGTRLWQ